MDYEERFDLNKKKRMNRQLYDFIKEESRSGGVDLIFFYVSGMLIEESCLKKIAALNIPMVNFIYNDIESFEGDLINGRYSGQVDIATHFDFVMTSIFENCEKYMAIDARPYYITPGANPDVYSNKSRDNKDIDVVFYR